MSSEDLTGDAARWDKTNEELEAESGAYMELPPPPNGPLDRPYWCSVGAGYALHWADHVWEGKVLTACNSYAGPPASGWEVKHVAVCYWCKRKMRGEG